LKSNLTKVLEYSVENPVGSGISIAQNIEGAFGRITPVSRRIIISRNAPKDHILLEGAITWAVRTLRGHAPNFIRARDECRFFIFLHPKSMAGK